ncbi:uncharacterized protein LOC123502779 isoform X2 [Portunus trituberculatus]|uniref:uncharacterized protein LOC123502779 isoform X2 n=1 Tax=Portunus trituberculatus TaxID=210409 RepID=UPI001E1D01EB|nr:uncharacterized protein LOC123502779 isoform X2 [Portunus trituberculatus]
MSLRVMEWMERAAEWCCWCRRGLCRYSKPAGEMPRNHRAQVASPVLLQADLSCTPLVDSSEEEGMDLVLFDTRVDYETTRSRSHTTLSGSPRLQDLRQELLEACEREGEPAHTCYEMDVELESPHAGEDQGREGMRLGSHQNLQAQQYPRKSSVSTVFRALKCIEGEELAQEDLTMMPLEVPRIPRSTHRAPPGYASLNRATIDY